MGKRFSSVCLGASAVALAVALTGCPERVPRPEVPVTPVPSTPLPTPPPSPTPPPTPYVPNKRMEVGRMFNGAQVRTSLETDFGTSATAERALPSSYEVEVKVRVKIPKPNQSLEELGRLNSKLPELLPALPALLADAKVSPSWDDLYRLKVAQLQRSLNRFDDLLSRHNLFDCETILEFQHPQSKRRAVFIQADMDTDGDGSDSDRVPEIDGTSSTFQPFTSYRWPKTGDKPNSFIIPRESRLRQYQAELAGSGVGEARARDLREASVRMKTEIADLKKYSFLVAATDPFIVLPLSMVNKKSPFSPGIGDYCVVVYGSTLYPAVVGDAGPAYKTGEGSLRLCKQLSSRADANNRAVSDLKVSYLVFPGTAEKPFAAPDLERWRTRCSELLEEVGGYRGELFVWEDLTKPKLPPATPVPATPAPGTPAPGTPSPGTPAPATPPAATPAPATPPPATPSPAVSTSAQPEPAGSGGGR